MKTFHLVPILLVYMCSVSVGVARSGESAATASNSLDWTQDSGQQAEISNPESINMQRFERHIQTKRGGDDPSQIPLPNRMRMFLPIIEGVIARSENYREEIGKLVGLSDSDTDILVDFAEKNGEFVESTKEFTKQILTGLCDEHLDEHSSAVDSIGVGLALNDMRFQIRHRETEHYETLFSALSVEGELSLRRYLSENIAARMNSTEIDFAGMFAEDPTAFQQNVLLRICSFAEEERLDGGRRND